MSFDLPSNGEVVGPDLKMQPAWMKWATLINQIARSAQESGTTADRPTELLWIGRRYYDRTLNIPVYVSAVKPTVWRNAAGVVV